MAGVEVVYDITGAKEIEDLAQSLNSSKLSLKRQLGYLHEELRDIQDSAFSAAELIKIIEKEIISVDSKIEKIKPEFIKLTETKSSNSNWDLGDGIDYFKVVSRINRKFPGLLLSLAQMSAGEFPVKENSVSEISIATHSSPSFESRGTQTDDELMQPKIIYVTPVRDICEAQTQTNAIDFLKANLDASVKPSTSRAETCCPDKNIATKVANEIVKKNTPVEQHVRVPRKPGCWNCGCLTHQYTMCDKPFTRIFCFHCGYDGYKTRDCPNCDGKLLVEGIHYKRKN